MQEGLSNNNEQFRAELATIIEKRNTGVLPTGATDSPLVETPGIGSTEITKLGIAAATGGKNDLPANVRSTPANALDDLKADFLTKYGAAVKGVIAAIGTTWWLCNLIAEFGNWTGPAIILNFSWATMAVSVFFAVICTVCDRRIHIKQDTLGQDLNNITPPSGAKLTKKSQMLLTGSTLSDGLGIAGGLTMIADIIEMIIQKNFIENLEFSPWVTLGILAGAGVVGMFAVLSERRTHKKVLLQCQELDKLVSPSRAGCSFLGGCWGRGREPEADSLLRSNDVGMVRA